MCLLVKSDSGHRLCFNRKTAGCFGGSKDSKQEYFPLDSLTFYDIAKGPINPSVHITTINSSNIHHMPSEMFVNFQAFGILSGTPKHRKNHGFWILPHRAYLLVCLCCRESLALLLPNIPTFDSMEVWLGHSQEPFGMQNPRLQKGWKPNLGNIPSNGILI